MIILFLFFLLLFFDQMDGGEERVRVKSARGGGGGSGGSSPMTIANRFAELMLVVGVDDNTGLVPLNGHGLEVIIITVCFCSSVGDHGIRNLT